MIAWFPVPEYVIPAPAPVMVTPPVAEIVPMFERFPLESMRVVFPVRSEDTSTFWVSKLSVPPFAWLAACAPGVNPVCV